MADPTQNQQAQQEEKFSLFKIQDWPGLIWNRFWRLPGIKRFRVGRAKVGGRPHPIEEELRATWISKNDFLFNGPLETIEKAWDSESFLVGFNDQNKDALILGNPNGIVPLYMKLGPYSDIDRIETEKHWFQFGTGFEEDDVPYELPNENEQKEYAWVPDNVNSLKNDTSEPWKKYMVKKYKLNKGEVFHEGKQEYKEELYSFGFHKLRQLGPALHNYFSGVIHEDLRRQQVSVEFRTKFEHVNTEFEKLFQAVAKIEEDTYNKLSDFTSLVEESYGKLWESITADCIPEKKDIIMRFEHTYRIVKIYHYEKLEKVKVKRVDDNGQIIEEEIDEVKLVYSDPNKNTYKREFDEIEAKIRRLGGDSVLRTKADQYLTRINGIDNYVRLLKLRAIKENFKKYLLTELYGQFETTVKDNQRRTQFRNFVKEVSGKVDQLANSSEQEFEMKKNDLFNILIDELLKEGIININYDIDKIREQLELDDSEVNNPEIRKLKIFLVKIQDSLNKITKGVTILLGRMIQLIQKRKELLDLLFKKEQLKFYIDHIIPNNPRFHKRPEEIDYGLDENGYPLEVNPENGMVLIDKWWNELAQNDWQLKTIAKKPGGVDLLKRHLGLDVEFRQPLGKAPEDEYILIIGSRNQRRIRYVDDKRFREGKVDLLDLACIVFGIWDEVRDDLRDGRYHKHSKSVGDYVIEGMGGFDDELAAPYLKRWATFGPVSKGMFVTRRGMIPIKSAAINVNFRDHQTLVMAKPSDFENTINHLNVIPKEEEAISRKFKLRIPEGVNLPTRYRRDDITRTPQGNFLEGTRRVTKYNPAFDRRAETFGNYMHWGKMYYYRWSGYSNEWSENPFPQISTRGIALYIAFLTATDVWHYSEGEQSLKGHKYDYGVRGQNKFGYNNPLSGEYILQET